MQNIYQKSISRKGVKVDVTLQQSKNTQKVYNIEEEGTKLLVFHPFSYKMNEFWSLINARWDQRKRCRITSSTNRKVVERELYDYYGDDDAYIYMVLKLKRTSVRGRLVIDDDIRIDVDPIMKHYSNINIITKLEVIDTTWIIGDVKLQWPILGFFTGLFRPWIIKEGSTITVRNMRKHKVLKFLRNCPSWVSEIKIEEMTNN